MAGAASVPCGTAALSVTTACGGFRAFEIPFEKLNHGIVGVAFDSGDNSDSCTCQRTERTRADPPADDDIDRAAYQQKTKFFVSGIFGDEIFSLRNFAIGDGKYLKLIRFPEMLKNIAA